MRKAPELIGIAGTQGAGKDTISGILADDYGYIHVSTGDIVRAESLRRHGSLDRRMLHDTANSLRAIHGAGALCLEAIRRGDAYRNDEPVARLAVSGIRAVGEAEVVKDGGGFLLFVDAPAETRYSRLIARGRQGEFASTLQEFVDFEARESSGDGQYVQNIKAVRSSCDQLIYNNNGLPELAEQVKQMFENCHVPNLDLPG
jgi:dephospho-CoA kinase